VVWDDSFFHLRDDSIIHKPERISSEGPVIQKEDVKGADKEKEADRDKERCAVVIPVPPKDTMEGGWSSGWTRCA